jgi:hypothetical protein
MGCLMLIFGYGLCRCGCGGQTAIAHKNQTREPRWVKGEPKPFLPHHKPPRKPDNYIIDETTGCWVWQGAKWGDGYDIAMRQGKPTSMVRLYWEQAHGRDFPEGMVPDHLCRNRACVNPDHIEPITQRENIRRGRVAKLTIEQVREIRALRGIEHFHSIAARYNVTANYIHGLWRGVAWGD